MSKLTFAPNLSNTFVKNVDELDDTVHVVVKVEGDKAIVRNLEYFDFSPLADDLYNDLYEYSVDNYGFNSDSPFNALKTVTHPKEDGHFVVEVNENSDDSMVNELVEFYKAKGYAVVEFANPKNYVFH